MLAGLIARIPPRYRWLAGTCALLLAAWVCMYGKIWSFEKFDAHRFTSMAMLTGTLRLRGHVLLAGHDEQVFNGAVYTNWGFGVPLLQLPFHALARATHLLQGFFPDRAIYFLYLAPMLPFLWAAFDRLLAMQPAITASPGTRMAVSWAATWMVLHVTLFPLMETRFVVYEETLAYMTVAELVALGAYLFALRSWSASMVSLMAIASGIGLLVRPIGLLYVAVWGALVLLARRPKKTLLFGAVLAPFVAFWLYGNFVKSGSVVGLGFQNSNPAWEYEMPLLRFGTTCADSPWHALQAAGRLFGAFFVYVWRTPSCEWMRTCHFDFEERDSTREPYFGPAVLVLLCGMIYGLVRRRERRLSLWVPYIAFALLFAAFVRRGEGFAWRYVADFWPLIVLAAVDYVRTLPPTALRVDPRMAKIMFWVGFVALARFLVPWEWSSGGPNGRGRADVLSPGESASMWEEFRASRWGVDGPLPSRLSCGDHPKVPYNNGLGWRDECRVATFTNVYLGVPPKEDTRYALHVHTEGMTAPSVKVYVNGAIYTAERRGDEYVADVVIRYQALTSPNVVATVLWTRDPDPPPARLLSIELV
jgi:hypothetical protein